MQAAGTSAYSCANNARNAASHIWDMRLRRKEGKADNP